MRFDFDILVVGGGPAGSACAIQLARAGLKAALVEAGDFSKPRVGEILHPKANSLLQRMGVDTQSLATIGAPLGGVLSIWGKDRAVQRNSTQFSPFGTGFRLKRSGFDRLLFELAASAGVHCFFGSQVVGRPARQASWEFGVRTPVSTWSGQARSVVEATGRSRSSPFVPSRQRLYRDKTVAVAFHSAKRNADRDPYPEEALVESVEHGWWYSVLLPAGEKLLVYFTDYDLLPAPSGERRDFLLGQLRQTELTRQRMSSGQFSAAVLTSRNARMSIRRHAKADGWIAVGDSHLALDPLSGRGIVEALQSASETAEYLTADPDLRHADVFSIIEKASRRYNRDILESYRSYAEETTWRDSPFWNRRQLPGEAFAVNA